MKIACVTAAAALAWVKGDMDDEELFQHYVWRPQVMFVAQIDRLADWFKVARLAKELAAAGCVTLIGRTGNPTVRHKLKKEGCLLVSHDRPPLLPYGRWIAPPESFHRWTTRLKA